MDESQQRRQGDRRRLWDRRAPDPRRADADRRRNSRRSGAHEGLSERRVSSDRRQEDRRDAHDRRALMGRRRGRRRRETPAPFSAQDTLALQERFAAPGRVSCPACGSGFTLGSGRHRGGETARRVMCVGCGRTALIPKTYGARVIVIDHLRERRDALQTVLASAGHEVVEASDAAVALHAYQAVPADVVFIDVLAPGRIEAPEFVRRLLKLFPDARVVAMAATPSNPGAFDAASLMKGQGAARTIRTPVSSEDVLRTVQEIRA